MAIGFPKTETCKKPWSSHGVNLAARASGSRGGVVLTTFTPFSLSVQDGKWGVGPTTRALQRSTLRVKGIKFVLSEAMVG